MVTARRLRSIRAAECSDEPLLLQRSRRTRLLLTVRLVRRSSSKNHVVPNLLKAPFGVGDHLSAFQSFLVAADSCRNLLTEVSLAPRPPNSIAAEWVERSWPACKPLVRILRRDDEAYKSSYSAHQSSRAFPKFESFAAPRTGPFSDPKAQRPSEQFHGIGRLAFVDATPRSMSGSRHCQFAKGNPGRSRDARAVSLELAIFFLSRQRSAAQSEAPSCCASSTFFLVTGSEPPDDGPGTRCVSSKRPLGGHGKGPRQTLEKTQLASICSSSQTNHRPSKWTIP